MALNRRTFLKLAGSTGIAELVQSEASLISTQVIDVTQVKPCSKINSYPALIAYKHAHALLSVYAITQQYEHADSYLSLRDQQYISLKNCSRAIRIQNYSQTEDLFLFYDRIAGKLACFTLNLQHQLRPGPIYSDWRKGWDLILDGSFGNKSGQCILFYERIHGYAELYMIDNKQRFHLQKGYMLGKDWENIIHVSLGDDQTDRLLFYNRSQQMAVLYTVNSMGYLTLNNHYVFDRPWDLLLAGTFSTISPHSLLCYSRANQLLHHYTLTPTGELTLINSQTDPDMHWHTMLAGRFTRAEGDEILSYHQETSRFQHYHLEPSEGLQKLPLTANHIQADMIL